MEWLSYLILVTAVGGCVGSFLNVVIYRLPEGRSIVSPPSSCPSCGARLKWFDNVPVLAWLWLRGRCRNCRTSISVQYPLVEALTASLFAGLFLLYYRTGLIPAFSGAGIGSTWPLFVTHAVLLASMLAATVIDARTFEIPLGIPWAATAVAVVVLPFGMMLEPHAADLLVLPPVAADGAPLLDAQRLGLVPAPYANDAGVQVAVEFARSGSVVITAMPYITGPALAMTFGATIGLIVAIILLRTGVLPLSFDLPEDDETTAKGRAATPAPGADPADELNARREVLKECLFLSLPVAGAVVGWLVGGSMGTGDGAEGPAPVGLGAADHLMPAGITAVQVLGGVLLGYLAGGLSVWSFRILGTLGVGREAMGLGDVHLMGAVGAAIGWKLVVVAFFVAPFFGLAWAVAMFGASSVLKQRFREVPYGPHLAVGSLTVMVFREPLLAWFGAILML